MEKGQLFDVEIDGKKTQAELIDILEQNNNRYAVYFTENEDSTSEIYVSKVITNSEGYDELVDVDDESVKRQIMEIIEKSLEN